jgi:hypothetical protein
MIPRTSTMRTLMGRTSQKVDWPAMSSVNRIASVAYATDDRLSLENTASACTLDRRSVASSADASGRPSAACRARSTARRAGFGDSIAAGRATRTSGAACRK